MSTMISYELTAAAQKTEIAAGRDGNLERTVDVDLTPYLDEPWVCVDRDGGLHAVWSRKGYSRKDRIPTPCDHVLAPDTDEAAQVLAEAARTDIETERREMEEAIVEWVSKPDDDKLSYDYQLHRYDVVGYSCLPSGDDRVRVERERLTEIARHRTEEREREKSEIEQRKINQLADAVTRLGSDVQRERWAAGVMPRSEAIALIRSDLLRPAVEAGLTPLRSDVWHCTGDADAIISQYEYGCEETEKRTLSNAQYENVRRVRDILGDSWQYEYYQQTIRYEDDEPEYVALVRASIDVGEYGFSADILI